MADNRKSILMRAYLVYILVLLFGLTIIGRIIYLQWVEGDQWKQRSKEMNIRYKNIEARRGNIYSDNESLLASSVTVYDLGMDVNPIIVPDSIFNSKVDSLAVKLGALFHLPKAYFLSKLKKARREVENDSNATNYVLLKRNVSYAQMEKIKTFPIFKSGRLKGGLVTDGRELRELPFKNLAQRTIGYVHPAWYDATIDLSKAKFTKEHYENEVDTLSLYMYNLFHDGISNKSYRALLDRSYYLGKSFTKRLDGRQLKALKSLPLIDELVAHNLFKAKKIKDEYKVGLEGSYNEILCGRDGTITLKKMGRGTWRVLSDEDLVEPKNGYDIYTSVDINLQDIAENALRKCLDSNNAAWGCAVLMEVNTGLIKSIVNLTRDSSGNYREKFNYAVGQQIEPGSTFKLASVIAVLEEGKYDTSSLVPTGTGRVGNREVKDSHEQGYGKVTLNRAFEVSSNLGISNATYNTFSGRADKFKALLKKMGLTEPIGIDIKGEPVPKMNISQSDLETIPYGYVIKLTPLQILSLYNAVANDGNMVQPHFVKSIGRAGTTIYEMPVKTLKNSICSKSTLDKVHIMLEGVVKHGTASNISKSDYQIAGKTGTVKIFEKGDYIEKYVASFVGYFPVDKPEYSCIVVVSRPNGNEYYGSLIAAPVFKEIADKVYAMRLDIHSDKTASTIVSPAPLSSIAKQDYVKQTYDILNFRAISSNSSAEWVSTERTATGVSLKTRSFIKNLMPDVTGMAARDAVYLLENLGLKVKVSGKGTVLKQSVQAGLKIIAGQEIMLNLSML